MDAITPESTTTTTLSRPPRPLGVDIDDVGRLWSAPGPYVSAFVDLRPDQQLRMAAWATERRRVEDAGAPEAALAVVDTEVARPPDEHNSSLALLAAADGTALRIASPDPLREPMAVVESLPRVAPVIDWAQRTPAHLVVEVGTTSTVALVFDQDGSVVSHEIRRELADCVRELARLAVDHDAAVVVLGGPSHLVRGVRSMLEPQVPEVAIVAVPDASEDELAESAVRAVADDVARDTVTEVRALRLGRESERTADGVVEVVDALRAGRVDTLVVADDPDDRRHAWFDAGAHVAIDLEHAGVPDAASLQQGRLVEVLVRSCVLQGGTVRVVPTIDDRRLPGGVGAALIRPA